MADLILVIILFREVFSKNSLAFKTGSGVVAFVFRALFVVRIAHLTTDVANLFVADIKSIES